MALIVAASGQRWDLIQLALLDSFAASSAGLYALSESYLYTREALDITETVIERFNKKRG